VITKATKEIKPIEAIEAKAYYKPMPALKT